MIKNNELFLIYEMESTIDDLIIDLSDIEFSLVKYLDNQLFDIYENVSNINAEFDIVITNL